MKQFQVYNHSLFMITRQMCNFQTSRFKDYLIWIPYDTSWPTTFNRPCKKLEWIFHQYLLLKFTTCMCMFLDCEKKIISSFQIKFTSHCTLLLPFNIQINSPFKIFIFQLLIFQFLMAVKVFFLQIKSTKKFNHEFHFSL